MDGKRTWRNILYSAWDVGWIKVAFAISTARSRFSLWLQGCKVGRGFVTSGTCSFKARNSGSIRIGNGVQLLADWRSNRVGLSGPVLFQTYGEGIIEIGDCTGGSAVVLSSRSNITVGNHVNLGGNVRIYDHDFHALDPELRRLGLNEQAPHVRTAPVKIGDDVFVGANSIILKGVTIGDRSLVSAGSVVVRGVFPADSLIGGNPAKLIKSLRP